MATIDGTKKKLTVKGELIESAVNSKHEHSNSAVLDKLSDNNGTLQYNGADITGGSGPSYDDSEIKAEIAKKQDKLTAGANITIDTDGTISATGGGSEYELPTATTTTLGGVKVDGSTIKVNPDGVITAKTGEATNNALYELKGELGLGTLKGLFDKRVDNYIKSNGYKINGITKTRAEIKDWLLNRDNCKYHGKLYKNGKYLVDLEGKPVEIRGIGTHHLLQFKNLHTKECLETLKYYGINCIRLSAYLKTQLFSASKGEYAIGYVAAVDETRAHIEEIVSYCVELGLYVILDWHMHATKSYADMYETEAIEFFTYFSAKYKDTPNVIYELANEPYSITAAELITFISKIRPVILANDPDAIMICGNASGGIETFYTKLVQAGYTDIFVCPHSYGESVKAQYNKWFDSGYPLFVSEWGNSNGYGDGEGNDAATTDLLSWLNENCVANCFWKYTDQKMTTSILKNRDGAIGNAYYKYGGFTEEDLSYNGKLYLNTFQDYAFENHIERIALDTVTSIDTEQYKEKGVSVVVDNSNAIYVNTDGNKKLLVSSYFNVPIKPNTYYKIVKLLDGNKFRGGIHREAITKTSTEKHHYNIFDKLIAYDDTLDEVTFFSGECSYLTLNYSSKYENCKLMLVEITADQNTKEQSYDYSVGEAKTLTSISATFNQGSNKVYTTDNLNTLKQYLTVTATYNDSTTATVTSYTLSGTLTEGTSTITVTYGGKTTTFDVTVTASSGGDSGDSGDTTDYSVLFKQGKIDHGSYSWIDNRLITSEYIDSSYTSVTIDSGFLLVACVWDPSDSWLGYYNYNTGVCSPDGVYKDGTLEISPIYEKFPGSHIKIMIKKTNNAIIEVKNISGKITFATA